MQYQEVKHLDLGLHILDFFDRGRKDLTQGKFTYRYGDECYENFNEIIPNDKTDTYFDVKEVEIYKIFE